jgi:hypothetical protein
LIFYKHTPTEDELDNLEDGSAHNGVDRSSNSKQHCHTCGTTGQWYTPQDCPVVSRACRNCSQMGHLAKACPFGTHLTTPLLTLAKLTNEANQHSAFDSDTDSSEGTKSLATTDNLSVSGLSDNSRYDYAESNASQDSVRSLRRQVTYQEIGRFINLMNNHNRPNQSHEEAFSLDDLDTSLLARWKDVLHEIGDRDGKQTTEDQHLTAVLGMAIGHTRRLHARFTNEAPGTDLHQKILHHATRLDPASRNNWPHHMGLQTSPPPTTMATLSP